MPGVRPLTGKKGEVAKMTPQTESMLKSGTFYVEIGGVMVVLGMIFDIAYLVANTVFYTLGVQLSTPDEFTSELAWKLYYGVYLPGVFFIIFGFIRKKMNGEAFPLVEEISLALRRQKNE